MLAKISSLVEQLNASGLRYCHWKSNFSLARTILGRTDVDLLVHRQSAPLFRAILTQHGFRPVMNTDGKPFPSVEHYYALDEDSGDFVHVHAYYRVITGDSLAKNYHLPIEEMLLQHACDSGPIRVPTKAAELVTFTLRILLKHTSLMELLLLSRYWGQAQDEIKWLAEDHALDDAMELIGSWLPTLETDFFSSCVDAVQTPAALWKRLILAHRLRSRLRIYARHSAIRAWVSSAWTLLDMSVRRFVRDRKNMLPQSGGAVIAFVGSEATGKSTLLLEMNHWLGKDFAVQREHAGKPAPTVLTAVPTALLPILRAVFPRYRSTQLEAQYTSGNPVASPKKNFPLIYGIRSVLLAHDRRSLLTRAFSRAANGTIVLCDRYPSLYSGAPDSPQLSHLPVPPRRYSIRRWLARTEARLYQEIPPPDLVIQLSAPLEVSVLRNVMRDKTEPEDYVRRRYAQSVNLDFGKTPVYKIDTDQPFAETVREVKQIIWNYL